MICNISFQQTTVYADDTLLLGMTNFVTGIPGTLFNDMKKR